MVSELYRSKVVFLKTAYSCLRLKKHVGCSLRKKPISNYSIFVEANGNQQVKSSKENRKRSQLESAKTVSLIIIYRLNKIASIRISLL